MYATLRHSLTLSNRDDLIVVITHILIQNRIKYNLNEKTRRFGSEK